MNERDSINRSPLLTRLLDIFWKSKVCLHLIYFTFCSVGIARSAILWWKRSQENQASLMKDALIHFGWPPLLWLVCLNSAAIPIGYAFLPPTIPQREQLLKRDPVLRASYPQDSESDGGDTFLFGQHASYSVCMLYTLGLFVCTWNMSVACSHLHV